MSLVYWILGNAVYWTASVGIIFMIARMILDWALFFAPTWRPTGLVLILANVINRVTDPALRLMRRYIPPLRLGPTMAIDVGFMLIFLGFLLLQRIGMTLLLLGL